MGPGIGGLGVKLLGPHVIKPSGDALDWSKHANVVKALDDPTPLRQAAKASVLVYRAYFPEQRMDADAGAVAATILGRLGNFRHPGLYVETFNETQAPAAELIAFHRRIVPILHAAGVKVAGPCWSTGAYEASDWAAFRAAGWCGLDAIALHAYWGNQGFTIWHATRYRQWWQPGDPPVIVTEGGRDKVEGGKGGWKADGLTEDAYFAELRAYDAEIAKDAYVLGATVFTCGPTPDWRSFDADPIVGRAVAAAEPYPPRGPQPAPTPQQPAPASVPAPRPTPQPGGTPVDTNAQYTMPRRTAEAFYLSENEGNYSKAKRAKTIGVVVHSTAGSSALLVNEYRSTVNWFQNPDAGVSAHVVVGPDEVATCVPEDLTAYHARENNADRLGLELAWPDTDTYNRLVKYPPAYYEFAGEVIARWALKYGFPLRWVASQSQPGLILHKEAESGKRDGKRDPTGLFDKDALLVACQRWYAKLGGKLDPTPIPQKADVGALRDEAWALAERFEKAGQPWTGQAIKSAVALSKGER